jgi:molybdopterin-binding protein
MNKLIGNITSIKTSDVISLIKIIVGDILFTSIVIDTPETLDYLKIGNAINLYFKETEIIISKTGDLKISLQNQIPCKIVSINLGLILSELHLMFGAYKITAIITSNACEHLHLQENDKIIALIKPTK